jgi:Leucine rich repeat
MLDSLETISIDNNRLGGTLPACITDLSFIVEFDVHGNDLSGPPPSGFLDMPRLQMLDLSSNSFSGALDFLSSPDSGSGAELPPSKLQNLFLDNNSFDGEVPDGVLDRLVELEQLSLHATDVTGDVSSLCLQPSIAEVYASCDELVCEGECCNCIWSL